MLNHKYAPPFPRSALTLAQARVWGMDHPVGYAYGGAAYGQYLSSGFWSGVSDTFQSVGNVVTQAASTAGDIFSSAGREIGNFVGSAARETGNFFSQVGREIGNAANVVYREVIQPVGKVVESVGQAIANDPITFVATVAAVATQQYWAVPLIQGASVAAHGGKIEDVLKATAISAATTWAGGQIGGYLTNSMGTTVISNGVSSTTYSILGNSITQTTAQTIGNVVGYSAASAAGAAAMGKNGDQILTTALASGAGAAIPGLLANVPGFNELANGTLSGIPADVSKAIANGITNVAGAVVGSAIANKDMGTAVAASLITSGIQGLVSTKNIVTDMFKSGSDALGVSSLPPQTQSIVANTLAQVFATGLTGGKAGNALMQSMMSIGTQSLQKYITEGIKQGSALVDKLFDDASKVQLSFDEYAEKALANRESRNDVAEEMNDIVTEEKSLSQQYDDAQNSLDAFLIKSKGYQDQYDQKYALYNQYLSQANTYATQVNSKGVVVNTLGGKVNTAAQNVNNAIQNQKNAIAAYDTAKANYNSLNALYQDGNSNAFKNTFNSSWYLQQYPDVAANGTYGADPYRHFIEHGYGEGRAAYPGYIGNLDTQAAQLRSYATQANDAANNSTYWANQAKDLTTTYNAFNTQYQAAVTDYNNLKKTYDDYVGKATSTASQVQTIAGQLNQVNTLINQTVTSMEGINDRIETLNTEYTDLNKQLVNYDKTIAADDKTLQNLNTQYGNITKQIETAAEPLNKEINQLTSKITNDLVAVLDPDFNAAQYKEINGLGDGIDAATHWLAIGKNQGLYTNTAAADAAKYEAVYDLATAVAKQRGYASGFDVSNAEWAKLYSDIEKHYGNDIAAMKSATPSTFAWETGVPVSKMISAYDESKLADNASMKETYGAWNAPENLKTPNGTKLATQEEYFTGKATPIQTKDGNIAYVVSDGTQSNKVYNKETGEMVDSVIGWNTGDIKNVTVIGADGQEYEITEPVNVDVEATRLNTVDPMEQDPLAAMYTFNTMDAGLLGDWSKPGDRIIEGSKAIIAWAEEKAKTGESSNILAIASNVVGGFGEQFQSFAGLAALVGTQPENTDLYKLGQKLIDLQKSSTPADFAKRYAEFEAQYQNVTGLEKGWAFIKGAVNYPSEFMMGMVLPEIAQEVIPTLLGAGVGKIAASGAGALASVAPKIAAWASKWAGVTTAAASDVAESFGANYNDTYKEAKTLAAKAHPEWSKQQIEEYATNQGLTVGLVGALTTGISMGVGGAELAKSLLGPKASAEAVEGLTGWLGNIAGKLTSTGKIMIKEGFSEAVVEEMPTQLVKDLLFLPIDPNRDIAGNVALAGAQAFTTAGMTTGSISAAHQTALGIAEVALQANDAFIKAINGTNGNAGQLGNVLNQWLPMTTAQGAGLRNTIVPAIFEQHPDWGLQYATAEDYARTVATLGVKDPVALTELVDKRFDTAVTTGDELATELYNKGLTDVTLKDVQAVLGTGTQTTTQVSTAAADYVNKNMVSQAEVQAAATQEGYKYTQAEMDALVGRGVQADVIQKFIQEIDPKAVTTAEATQYFKDLGYTKATAADIATFVKSAPEAEVQAAVAAWVDPKQVTRTEAVNFYKALGYIPTEAEINQYVVQGPEVVQDTIKKNLETYVDPRMVDAAEVQALAQQRGLSVPVSDADIARLTGQYAESELAGKFEKDLPVISANATYAATQKAEKTLADKIAANESAGMERDQAMQAAIDATAEELGTTRTDLLNKIDLTSQQFTNQIEIAKTDLGKQITLYQQQTGQQLADTKAEIQAQMAAYEKAGMDRDTALSLAISGVAQDLGTTKTDLLTKIGSSETALRNEFTQQTTALSTQVKDVAALLGKPVSQVTANDITMVKNMIAGQTQTNLAYDINQDGKIDINDQVALQTQLDIQNNPNIKQQIDPNTGLNILIDTTTGKPVDTWEPTAGTQWAASGIYDILQKQQEEAANVAKTATEKAKVTQQKTQFGSLMGMLFSAPDAAGQTVSVKTPDPARINYIYDFGSIFANPSQASLMPSPYGAMNTVMPMQPQQRQAANQDLYGAPYKMAVGGFAEGGIVGGNDIQVGGGSIDDLLNILKGNG